MHIIWLVLLAATLGSSTLVPILDGKGGKDGKGRPFKIMFVGDSITHGHEAAYTWRFRMWQWLTFNKIPFKFTGPYTGTIAPEEPKLLQPPHPVELPAHKYSVDDWPRVQWGYAEDIDKRFDPHHFATGGEQAARVSGLIYDQVNEFEPDILLILLGVNDFAWGFATPDVLLGSMKTLVDNARSANGNIRMAIGNVIQRSYLRPEVEAYTDTYNEMLRKAVPTWSSGESPIHYVDVASNYDCHANNTCPAGLDGLHPNDLGDFQIASIFTKTFMEDFAQGTIPVQIPPQSSIPDISPPSNSNASATPMGTKVTWERRIGITEYQVRQRREGEDWTMKPTGMNRSDTIFPVAGQKCDCQVRSCYGTTCGSWPEEIVSATSERATAPPPVNIRTSPTELGFNVTWDPPDGQWKISSYEIQFTNLKRHLVLSVGSERLWATLEGMKEGENSIVGEVIEVQMASWMGEGYGGVYSGKAAARRVLPGSSNRPESPTGLIARWRNSTTAKLGWSGTAGDAAGHLTYYKPEGADPVLNGNVIYENEALIPIGRSNPSVEVCVSAINGVLESPLACTVATSFRL